MNIILLGLGLIAPIGDLANMVTSGKELSARWEISKVDKIAATTEIRETSFNSDNLDMDIFKITEGLKLNFIKRSRITGGIGVYYVKREVNESKESEKGVCSTIGLAIPLLSTRNILVRQEFSWHTVPQGVSLTFYIGTKLRNH